MAETIKVLGQAAPGAGADVDVYTVPVATEVVISTIIIANRAATAASFRLAVRPNGVSVSPAPATNPQCWIAYDVPIAANDSTTLTLGLTLDATDVVTAYASNANLSFNLFGTEITP